MKIAGVILAAGYSRRLGRPKQDLVLAGATLLQRTIQTAKAARLHPLAVVVRELPATALDRADICWLLNPEAAEGMASSVRSGARWARDAGMDGLVIITCDQPQLRPEHLQALCAQPERIVGSGYAGRVGVPAYFPASAFGSLLQMQGDQGARGLLQGSAVIADESLALDIDTEDDLRKAEGLFPADLREPLTP